MVIAGRQWEVGVGVSSLGGFGRYGREKIKGEDENVLGGGGEELVEGFV